MIVLRNLDGTVGGFNPTDRHGASYVVVDHEVPDLPGPAAAFALANTFSPMFTRSYDRMRPRLWPSMDTDPRTHDGGDAVYLYEEDTAHVAPEQAPVRLAQVHAAIGRLHTTAAELVAVAGHGLDAAALSVARDAWLSGRLQDARAILRQTMSDAEALATVQQWVAEEWGDLP